MRTEFQINLKTSKNAISRKHLHKSITKEPVIRQYLVLAHQIKQYLQDNPTKTASSVASWLGYSPSRVSQLLNMLDLSPSIQEEILLSKDKKIYLIPEHKLRVIVREKNWEKQWEMWKNLRSS